MSAATPLRSVWREQRWKNARHWRPELQRRLDAIEALEKSKDELLNVQREGRLTFDSTVRR